ncbi:MAG: right-handed parallel beta-helix repeat-containing protein [Thermoplasmatota archaeon]
MRSWWSAPLIFSILLVTAAWQPVAGHAERETEFPAGLGAVPVVRDDGPYLVTCKSDSWSRIETMNFSWQERWDRALLFIHCQAAGFEHLQAAVNAVAEPGSRILMLPGLYQEEPYAAPSTGDCAGLDETPILEYEEHWRCPNSHNLVAVLGDDPADDDRACTTEPRCRLQIQGMGKVAEDVILDANWTKLNALRADRADGIVLTNFMAQRTDFNAVYILETDGFRIDNHKTRWNFEYGYLTFAVDHGLYINCESYGNGDSGIYPGSASDLGGARASVEITLCDSHHNALGYSGTAGNSVYAHHNKFHHNAAGIATDSLFPDHPGLPQDSARFVQNEIYSNNENYFDNWLPGGPCHNPLPERGIEDGVVCPVIPLPVGTGILIAGGNSNRVVENWIYDNWRFGTMLFGVPAFFRGEDGGFDFLCAVGNQDPGCFDDADPADLVGDLQIQFDTSHDNHYLRNNMGITPDGRELVNGVDHWWDEQGQGNCWLGNTYAGGAQRTDATDPMLHQPTCGQNAPVSTWTPPHPRLLSIVPCNDFKQPTNTHPDGCTWMDDPDAP